ncbi:hypothetical protein MKW92_011911 [Papaver armeniacum]|nr:hypothetical protein MKW92_011911 [Papaver armeniacum]
MIEMESPIKKLLDDDGKQCGSWGNKFCWFLLSKSECNNWIVIKGMQVCNLIFSLGCGQSLLLS